MGRADRERRERESAAARATSCEVVGRLIVLAGQLEDLGADLRAEVDRRKENGSST